MPVIKANAYGHGLVPVARWLAAHGAVHALAVGTVSEAVMEALGARGIDPGLRHAASSAAVLAQPEARLDLVRPGIMVFGHYPSPAEYRRRRIDLEPALALKTRVVCAKRLRAGDPVGYHRTYRAPAGETLVTGAIGYPDGYPAAAPERNVQALIGGRRHRLVAAVGASHIFLRGGPVDVGAGDEIVLYGAQGRARIALEEVAAAVERSEYHLLACLSPALPRFYRSGNRIAAETP